MMLRPAFFSLKVFIAEDIPQSKSFSYFFLEKNLLTKADDEVFPVFFWVANGPCLHVINLNSRSEPAVVEASNVINDPKCNKGPKCNNFWP